MISALAFLWPWSIWPKPSQDWADHPTTPIDVHVFRISEAYVGDTFIKIQINQTILYWRANAGILLRWDGKITSAPGCVHAPPIGPNCDALNDVYNLRWVKANSQNTTAYAEAKRRFWNQTGATYLFVTNFIGTEDGLDLPDNTTLGKTLVDTTQPIHILNLSILRTDQDLGLSTTPHETGHMFQLLHEHPLFNSTNLMCGRDGLIDNILNRLSPCDKNTSIELKPGQIKKARDAVQKLK